MKRKTIRPIPDRRNLALSLLLVTTCLSLTFVLPRWAETVKTRIGKLEFTSGYPTDKTVQKLYDELDFQRAVQAYLWAKGEMAKGVGPR